jgi:hypothetical protein
VGQAAHDLRVARGKMADQAAMTTQLHRADFAREPGAVVQQPGQAMHHARGRAQRFAHHLDIIGAHAVIALAGAWRALLQPGLCAQLVKPAARSIRQHKCLDIQRFDKARIDRRHPGHGDRIATSDVTAQPAMTGRSARVSDWHAAFVGEMEKNP